MSCLQALIFTIQMFCFVDIKSVPPTSKPFLVQILYKPPAKPHFKQDLRSVANPPLVNLGYFAQRKCFLEPSLQFQIN